MTNRDRLIETLQGNANADVYRRVLIRQITCSYLHENKLPCLEEGGDELTFADMCIACKEGWLSQELEFEMEE